MPSRFIRAGGTGGALAPPVFLGRKTQKSPLNLLLAWPQYVVHPLILVPRAGPVHVVVVDPRYISDFYGYRGRKTCR